MTFNSGFMNHLLNLFFQIAVLNIHLAFPQNFTKHGRPQRKVKRTWFLRDEKKATKINVITEHPGIFRLRQLSGYKLS